LVNAIAATFVMLWLTGWTLAAVRAGFKARNSAGPECCRHGVAGPGTSVNDLND